MPGEEDRGDGWVALARIVRPHGRLGEMAADLLTDDAARFASLARVYLCAGARAPEAFALRHAFAHRGRVVLALAGIGDRDAARAWTGAEVRVPAAERIAVPPGRYFISELVGCTVWDRDCAVGQVRAVTELPGAAPLLEVIAGGREILIPFAAAYLRLVDAAARRIEMDLPAGIVELNAAGESRQPGDTLSASRRPLPAVEAHPQRPTGASRMGRLRRRSPRS